MLPLCFFLVSREYYFVIVADNIRGMITVFLLFIRPACVPPKTERVDVETWKQETEWFHFALQTEQTRG